MRSRGEVGRSINEGRAKECAELGVNGGMKPSRR